MKRFEHFIRYQLPAVTWAAIIFVASSIPESKLPSIARDINDKIIHASIYFVLGLLVYRALEPLQPNRKIGWLRLILSIGVVIVYGISDEIHQGFVPGRTEDILDATADTVGGTISAIVMYIFERLRLRRLAREV